MPTNNFKVGEMLNKRSPNSKTWINFDGSYTAEIHSSVVHFEDENGNLHNINTDLFDEADFDVVDYPVAKEGSERYKQAKEEAVKAKKMKVLNRDNFDFEALRVPFECHIPRIFKRGYTIGKGKDKLTFKPVGSSPSKGYLDTGDRSIINYQDVWNDTDVQLKVLADGIKESIFVKSVNAPTKFSFEVKGDIENLTELSLAPAWLEDAEGTKRDVEQTIRKDKNKTYVDLVADVEGLVYPVEIDPTVIISLDDLSSFSTHVSQANEGTASSRRSSTIIPVGKTGMSHTETDNHGLLKFDLQHIKGIVNEANLYMEVSSQFNQTAVTIWTRRNTNDWNVNTVTWGTKPTTTTLNQVTSSVSGNSPQTPLNANVTNIVKQWVDGSAQNFGFTLINQNSIDYAMKSFHSATSSEVNKRPKLTINYIAPPTKPTVISPNGGETWNSLHQIQWQPSTSEEFPQSQLRYHIQLSTNNGSTWKDVVGLTSSSVTFFDYDFINEPESSTCLIRIRAYDGAIYGEWDVSDGVFTIRHNSAPSTPTNLSPSSGVRDRTQTIRFQWQHNDADNDPQAQFDLRWRLQGGSWNTITQATINNFYDMPNNTLPEGIVEWQVRTYDQEGLSSSYSNIAVFTTSVKPSQPTITSPLNNTTIPFSNPVLQWSSVGQFAYHVKVLSANDVLLWEIQGGTNKAQTILYDLQNGVSYKLQVAVRNAEGLWSDFASVTVNVSYTQPAIATVTTSTDANRGAITVNVVNPAPMGTEPTVTHNNIHRRIQGGEWERIAVNIMGSFTDFTPQSEKAYEYRVRSWGDNGTFTDSLVVSASVKVKHAQLSLVSDYGTWAEVKLNPKRNESQGVKRELMQFAGRKHAVAEFGEQNEFDLGLSFLVFDVSQLNVLRELVNSRETLLYRDNRGRKAFVTIDSLSIVDEQPKHYSVSVQPNVVSYTEVV